MTDSLCRKRKLADSFIPCDSARVIFLWPLTRLYDLDQPALLSSMVNVYTNLVINSVLVNNHAC